jgi:hypothetical protein
VGNFHVAKWGIFVTLDSRLGQALFHRLDRIGEQKAVLETTKTGAAQRVVQDSRHEG